MSNREILLQKMYVLIEEIDRVNEEEIYIGTRPFFHWYKDWVRELTEKLKNGQLSASNGGPMGANRALAEFDDLASIRALFNAASDVDWFYKDYCKAWDDE